MDIKGTRLFEIYLTQLTQDERNSICASMESFVKAFKQFQELLFPVLSNQD